MDKLVTRCTLSGTGDGVDAIEVNITVLNVQCKEWDIMGSHLWSEPHFLIHKPSRMDVNGAQRLKQLEDENRRLKQMVAASRWATRRYGGSLQKSINAHRQATGRGRFAGGLSHE